MFLSKILLINNFYCHKIELKTYLSWGGRKLIIDKYKI